MGTDHDTERDQLLDESREWTRVADEDGQAFGHQDPPTDVVVIRQRVLVIRQRTAAAGHLGIGAN
jgi:hypothetical protein